MEQEKSLYLSDQNVNNQHFKVINQLLQNDNTLEMLCLYGHKFGTEGYKHLSNMLKFNKHLKTLIMGCNGEDNDEKDCKYVFDALQNNGSLQNFSMRTRQIDDEMCKYIYKMLKYNETLQTITLDFGNITDEGCKYIGKALHLNNSLQKLDIKYDNRISDIGYMYIADGLKHNTALRKIFLDCNFVTDKGIEYMAKILETNTSIEFFISSFKGSHLHAFQCMLGALKKNSNITLLRLNYSYSDQDNISEEQMQQICNERIAKHPDYKELFDL